MAAVTAVLPRRVYRLFEPPVRHVRGRGGGILRRHLVAFECAHLELKVEEGEVGEDGPENATDCRDERWQRLTRRVERAAGETRLRHFFGREREEEGHEDVVDDEVECHLMK